MGRILNFVYSLIWDCLNIEWLPDPLGGSQTLLAEARRHSWELNHRQEETRRWLQHLSSVPEPRQRPWSPGTNPAVLLCFLDFLLISLKLGLLWKFQFVSTLLESQQDKEFCPSMRQTGDGFGENGDSRGNWVEGFLRHWMILVHRASKHDLPVPGMWGGRKDGEEA